VSGPLLAIFAHPDDETFSAAGLLAAASERGHPVTVLSATRGEAGKSSIPGLDTPERLGAVREEELREAMAVLGVGDVRFLGYRDSGLEDRPPDPLALTNAAIAEVAAAIATHLRDVRPRLVVTFGPDGIYGHPDHLHVHHAALRAIAAAASVGEDGASHALWHTSHLYFATAPREAMLAMIADGEDRFDWMTPEMKANLGTPTAEITHVLDISPWADYKRAAIFAHRTQTAPGGPLSELPDEQMDRWLSREHFVRAPLPWSAPARDDLLTLLSQQRHHG
jgi:LmbE family N-acetylglucosaminyl deacetylase